MKIKPYMKAIVGALVAGLTALSTALIDNTVTGQEWIAVVIATLTGLGVVYAVPNKTTD
jgi:hypothetical protein